MEINKELVFTFRNVALIFSTFKLNIHLTQQKLVCLCSNTVQIKRNVVQEILLIKRNRLETIG